MGYPLYLMGDLSMQTYGMLPVTKIALILDQINLIRKFRVTIHSSRVSNLYWSGSQGPEPTLYGTPCTHIHMLIHTKGQFWKPIHLLARSREAGGNLRTWWTPMQTREDHIKLHRQGTCCLKQTIMFRLIVKLSNVETFEIHIRNIFNFSK